MKTSAFVARAARSLVRRRLHGLDIGRLRIVYPDGVTETHGQSSSGPETDLRIHSWRLPLRVALSGDLGFAESFVRGEWSTDDVPALLRIFADNRDSVAQNASLAAWPRACFERIVQAWRRNTRRRTRRNIEMHYDLGNDFFALFLDPTMTYSCAIFAEGDSLEQAQRRKVQAIIDKAALEPHHHVLEIGSGWGSFALTVAHQIGCRVTTVTQSTKQRDHVLAQVSAAGLDDRIDVQLRDYRAIQGRYDRIVSIEMLEAVGHANLPIFFETCARLLKPGGRAVVQVITIRDHLYEAYRHSTDFIRRYIFPGGHLPSLQAIQGAVGTTGRLRIDDVEDIGQHYPRTLRLWREAFLHKTPELVLMRFSQPFRRTWEYYFSYCEAGFRAGMLCNLQLVIEDETPATDVVDTGSAP